MQRIRHHGWLVFVGLLFAAGHADAAPPTNPQVLYSFCAAYDWKPPCSDQQLTLGKWPQGVAAGPDGAYYGTTFFNNFDTDSGGSIYRLDPATRSINALYQFPQGYYPAAWLKVGPDGSVYGAYIHDEDLDDRRDSGGLFRLTPAGDFTIIHEAASSSFVCSEPVQDSLGNWIGLASFPSLPNSIYKIGPGGAFTILHTFPANARFGYQCGPNAYSVIPSDGNLLLASDGNLYGVIGSERNRGSALFRMAPDGTVTSVYEFDPMTEGLAQTFLTLGPDGALYGLLKQANLRNALYRVSLDGQFTNLGVFGPPMFYIKEKLTLMPDGYFYGSGKITNQQVNILFRLSSAGEYTQLYADPGVSSATDLSMLIRGFDNALYGTLSNGGRDDGGVLFRYVPPSVPSPGLKRKR